MKFYFVLIFNCIGDVMVSVLTSSVVDRGFEAWLEKEQKLDISESG
jgi:hypothetical protein